MANDAYRLAQAEKMFDLFQRANGRPPENSEELVAFLKDQHAKGLVSKPIRLGRKEIELYRRR